MADDNYTVEMRAIDRDFTRTVNKAIDALEHVEKAAPSAARRIEQLDAALNASAQSGKMTPAVYGRITSSINQISKTTPAAGVAVAGLRRELEELQKVQARRTQIDSAHKEAIAEDRARTQAAKAAAAERAATERAAAAAAIAAEKARTEAAKKEAAERIAVAKAEAAAKRDTLALRGAYNADPGFKQDAAGLGNEASTLAYTKRNAAANDELRQAILARGAAAQAVERAHTAAIGANTRETRNAAKRQQEFAESTYAGNLALDAQRDALSNNRYVLYDVASTWGIVSAATLGASVAAIKVASDYEYALASVQRTSGAVGAEWNALEQSLIDLSTAMPESFGDITDIATLGGQLGVAAEDIEDFTETVVRFSATTDVTAQSAAENIGRLAQLTGTASAEYENLAASIYETGINAVATESAILTTASQIATAGDLAGFANTEIVALASAFASLNIAPERARGSVQRIFGEIAEAVSMGGEQLTAFADLSAMSATEFAAAWRDTPQVAFSAFVEGLNQAQQAGEDTNSMLKDLGVGAVRDIQALQALANNTDVYNDALRDTSSAYQEGTAVAEGYAIVADTLQARFLKLKNSFLALVESIGDVPGVKATVTLLQQLVETLRAVTSNPVGGFFTSVAVAAMVAVGAFAAFKAATALAQASAIGLMQAERILSTEFAKNELSANKLFGTLGRLAVGHRNAASFTAAHTVALAANSSAMGRVAAAGKGVAAATGGAGAGVLSMAKGLAKGAGIFGLISVAISGVSKVANDLKPMSEKVDAAFGSLTALTDAMRADTEVYEKTGEAIGTIAVEATNSQSTLAPWAQQIRNVAGEQVALGDAAQVTTEKIQTQTVAIGEATRAAFAQAVGGNQEFIDYYSKYADALDRAGFSLETYFQKLLEDPTGKSGQNYLAELEGQIRATEQAQIAAISSSDTYGNELTNIQSDANVASSAISGMIDMTRLFEGTLIESGNQMTVTTALNKALGIEAEEAGDKIEDAADDLNKLVRAGMDAVSALAGTQEAIERLGAGFVEGGMAFDAFSENGRANLENLQGAVQAITEQAAGDNEALVGGLIGLMGSLQNAGADLTGDAAFLGQVFADVFGDTYGVTIDASAANASILGVIDNAIKALQAMAALERERVTIDFGWDKERGVPTLTKTPVGETDKSREIDGQIDQLMNLRREAANNTDAQKALGRGVDGANKKLQDGARAANNNAKGLDKSAEAAKKAKKEFRTLSDYASEVSSVFDRAYELRFSIKEAKESLNDAWAELRKEIENEPEVLVFDVSVGFDRVFAMNNARDAVTSQFIDMKESAADAARAVRDAEQALREANANIGTLEAQRAKLVRQISVSEDYGDTERVRDGRAQLAELEAQIAAAKNDQADATRNLADANSQNSRTLVGDTPAAIRNRAELQALAETHAEYVQAVIDSGASQKEISSAIKKSSANFEQQARALGYASGDLSIYSSALSNIDSLYLRAFNANEKMNESLDGTSDKAKTNTEAWRNIVKSVEDTATAMLNSGVPAGKVAAWLRTQRDLLGQEAEKYGVSKKAIKEYQGAISDMIEITKKVPKNVTSTVDLKRGDFRPAELALKEFTEKKRIAAIAANTDSKSVSNVNKQLDALAKNRSSTIVAKFKDEGSAASNRAIRKQQAFLDYWYAAKKAQSALDRGDFGQYSVWQKRSNSYKAKYDSYAVGGFTGAGGKYEEAGVVHKGEYVIPKEGVDQARGVPKPEYLASLFKAQQGMVAPTAPMPSGSNAARIQLVELLPNQLQQLAQMVSTEFVVDGQALTRVVNRHNKSSNSRGSA